MTPVLSLHKPAAPGVPAVTYSAKSTEDLRGSLLTQEADTLAAMNREGGRRFVAAYSDEGKSAFSGNRGVGLAHAKAHAAKLAAEHGKAELWVQHSDRLARGDGLTADHVGEVYFAMRKVNVRLRSVQDDSNLEDAIRAVLIGERNTEDSRRKSEAVKSGKRRAFERGELGGGPVPDGLRVLREVDERGKITRTATVDPERGQIIRRVFELAEEGLGDPSLAREMNRAGYRTRGGRGGSKGIAWTRRRVQDTLTNLVYAGAVVWRRGTADEEVNWNGLHSALVDRATFERLAGERARRDRAAGSNRNPKGRPNRNHALAGLATCSWCSEIMSPVTSTYRRTDGTRARTYLCRHVRDATGLCDAPPIDAEIVDRAVIADLDRYLGDLERWRETFIAGHEAERVALGRQENDALADLAYVQSAIVALEAKVERQIAAGDEAGADAVLAILVKRRPDRERAERRVAAVRDAIAAVPEDAPTDAMLDFYNALTDAVRGRLDRAGRDSMARVNEALRDLFERFILDPVENGVTIVPVLRGGRFDAPQTFYSVATREDDFAPPLRPVEAPSPNLARVQEYRWTKWKRFALAASHG